MSEYYRCIPNRLSFGKNGTSLMNFKFAYDKKRKTLETRFWEVFVGENSFKVIQGYFDNRSTNASAASFNAKIKRLELNSEVLEI
ncbi:hypothetical protein [Flavobacterium sp. LC2016-23]|uniref:hypothetical protein n=1 Tax=Flavobacterium sp. LC2016-23 TaxID=2666330 RepID=UPI001E643EE1|nr:hypothetical protein [Flavobacterium sp. LC2016-23]